MDSIRMGLYISNGLAVLFFVVLFITAWVMSIVISHLRAKLNNPEYRMWLDSGSEKGKRSGAVPDSGVVQGHTRISSCVEAAKRLLILICCCKKRFVYDRKKGVSEAAKGIFLENLKRIITFGLEDATIGEELKQKNVQDQYWSREDSGESGK